MNPRCAKGLEYDYLEEGFFFHCSYSTDWFSLRNGALSSSASIMLKTEPVDPYSVFRGRYLSLRYPFSTLKATDLSGVDLKAMKAGDKLYVVLKEKEKFWLLDSVSQKKPGRGEVFLAGNIGTPCLDVLNSTTSKSKVG